MPWILPESEVSGVLMSVCASTKRGGCQCVDLQVILIMIRPVPQVYPLPVFFQSSPLPIP
jgi:hypothetical protein